MSKKIVAIGGGGTCLNLPYELVLQDKEIINLTGKERPNVLILAHSQPLEKQEKYFQAMLDIYEKKHHCFCKDLKSNQLVDKKNVNKILEWADVIFECGGNTLDMIKLWQESGFDKLLKKAWDSGKVMCGVSAGANCWFKECSTDSLKIKYGDEQPLIGMQCLGFIEALFVPHCNSTHRQEHLKELLKTSKLIGLAMSNNTALEIIDDEYRLITSKTSKDKPYGLKAYWQDGKYYQELIDDSLTFKPLKELLSRNIKR